MSDTNNYIDFFNNNAGGIQAIFGVLIFIVTAVYTFVSFFMWKEMRKSRIKEEEPNISIRLIMKDVTEYLIEIKNISNVEVYDLKFVDFPKLPHGDRNTKDIGFLKYGISYLSVDQKYSNAFLRIHQLLDIVQNKDEEKNKILKFVLEYYSNPSTDEKRKKYTKEIRINLSLFANTSNYLNPDQEIVIELKKINQNIST
ncbi:MAG: hypothetical protein GQ534_08360 [Candidatus Delongbacteria bacterium]|nr:hypothetical protein [Candidatus Delongbacteria bacterium]